MFVHSKINTLIDVVFCLRRKIRRIFHLVSLRDSNVYSFLRAVKPVKCTLLIVSLSAFYVLSGSIYNIKNTWRVNQSTKIYIDDYYNEILIKDYKHKKKRTG